MDPQAARALEQAQGYIDLGMLDDGRAILESMEADVRATTAFLQAELPLLLKEKRWQEGLNRSRELARREPRSGGAFIHQAYCLHELGQTREAIMTLLGAPSSLRREPVYHYNLGCYHAQLGELKQARRNMEECFAIDQGLRHTARVDPDLSPLWNSDEGDGLL